MTTHTAANDFCRPQADNDAINAKKTPTGEKRWTMVKIQLINQFSSEFTRTTEVRGRPVCRESFNDTNRVRHSVQWVRT
jgi:predicted RNA-binding protein with PUA-like domain